MQVWPQTYTPILGEEQVAYMLEQFYTPESLQQQMESGQQYIICFDQRNEPVAFASYSPVEPATYKLNKIYILPGQQGRGVGKFVLDHIKTELKARNATRLILNVNIYNTNAIAFYERTGFKKFKEEDIDIGRGYFMNDYVLGIDL